MGDGWFDNSCPKWLRYEDFPGSLVVKTPRFHHRGLGFDLWLGNADPACGMV